MDKLREEFEKWFKFHSDEEECTNLLQRNSAGTNYLHPHADLAWIAWQASLASIVVDVPEACAFNLCDLVCRDDVIKAIRSIGLSIKGE